MNKVSQINKVIKDYFDLNTTVKEIAAKDMMSYFILAGVFPKDNKNGLPIRNILRRLDQKNELHKIPFVYADRKTVNTNWYFQRNTNTFSQVSSKIAETKPQINSISNTNLRKDSDEHYILDLCDIVLEIIGLRQYKFDFLLGDPNTKGVCAKLPVDIYYPDLNLVIEYKEQQHTKANKHFDKPDLFTISGIHRGEQRKIYDQRRRDFLPKNGITLIEINYSDFECDRKNRIIRNKDRDLKIVKEKLRNKITIEF